MARRITHRPGRQQSLFDTLNDFEERIDAGFDFIPDEEMKRIAARHREETEKTRLLEQLPEQTDRKGIFFMAIGSGSAGNCSYVGDGETGFLIDAGSDVNTIRTALEANGINPKKLGGILLTHDHHDHIASAYTLLRGNHDMKLYCTPRVLKGIMRRHNVSRRLQDYHEPIFKEHPFRIGDFEIVPFEVSHDASDNSGFFITLGNATFCIATDLGSITPRVDHYMRRAQSIVIEANYDLRMLVTGRYPEYLKARILAANGHLDNDDTARFIGDIYTPRLRHIFLCHLSHDNNTPEIAVGKVAEALTNKGVMDIATEFRKTSETPAEVTLMALPRFDATPLVLLSESAPAGDGEE